jgi:hypothetical protein
MSDAAIGGQTTVRYTHGALYGLAAVSIWSGWIVVVLRDNQGETARQSG